VCHISLRGEGHALYSVLSSYLPFYYMLLHYLYFMQCRTLSTGNVANQQHLIITVADTAGFQNPATCGRRDGATFADLCQNYIQERLHRLYRQSAISSVTSLCVKVRFYIVLK